jgi:hypothetical protein
MVSTLWSIILTSPMIVEGPYSMSIHAVVTNKNTNGVGSGSSYIMIPRNWEMTW